MNYHDKLFSSKKDAILIAQTPNGEIPFHDRLSYGDFIHDTVFTANSLNQILKTIGLCKAKVYPLTPVVTGFKSLVKSLLWKGIRGLLMLRAPVGKGSASGSFTQN